MPLVLLTICVGTVPAMSWNTVLRSSLVCSADTPLTQCEPRKARCPMRTRLSPSSSHQRDVGEEVRILAARALDRLQVEPVDQVDDLQMARQQPSEQVDRPGLQRLRQQRVVGVGERRARDLPGLGPGDVVLVHQDAHQFGHRDRRMGVVELHRGVLGKRIERAEFVEVAAGDVLQRGRGEEVFLPQPQLLALGRGVVGIEHARDRFGLRARGGRADHVAAVERGELDGRGRARRPQPQRIDVAPAPAGDRRVVRHRQHGLGRIPERARGRLVAADIFDHAAEADVVLPAVARKLPRVAAWPASPPDIPAASRRGCAARTARSRSGCRSRRRGWRAPTSSR